MFYDLEDCRPFRYDFYSLAEDMHAEHTSKNHEWCARYGYIFTGHALTRIFRDRSSTAATSCAYEFMQMPGIDWLGRLHPMSPKSFFRARQLGNLAS
ncbi:MAG: hypothetical protein ACLRSW_13125 [Christensenellaceae bacterium]